MTKDQFSVPFLRLTLHFERRKLEPPDEQAFFHSWFDLVRDLRGDVWAEVVARLMRTARFMPVPAEALALAEPVALELEERRRTAEYDTETRRREALGIPERNPRARDLVEAVAAFKKIIVERPDAPGRPQLTDYPADERALPRPTEDAR